MKKKTNLFLIGFLLLVVFAIVSIFTFYHSNQMIEKGYLASEGSAAEDFAVLAASNIKLTDAQVEKLKQYSYEELFSCEENEALRDMMDNENFTSRVDYAYIMVHLNKDEVKYQVTEENKELFDAPLGTPLDIMWLLDVNVSPESEEQAEGSGVDRNAEVRRYSYYIEEDEVIFEDAPTYIFNSSEWGDHICGYAPLYTVEGTYIGVLGVELQTSNFDGYRIAAVRSMGTLLFVSTVTLLLLFVVLYFQYKKIQFTRIYTDPLTKISNRSYYNDQFIKRMNGEYPRGEYFALMIADIDWFKKVNDTFGHEIGDQVLMEMGQILLDVYGKGHVIRFGGEEFVVGIWIKNVDELEKSIEKLYQTIRTHHFSSQEIEVTISLGCGYRKTEEIKGWLVSGMLKTADTKLYECKENGRNRYLIEAYEDGR